MPQAQSLSDLKMVADIPHWYAQAFSNTGFYLIAKYKDYETAKNYFQKALAIDPENSLAYEGLGDYFVDKKQCNKAEEAYQNASDIDFINKRINQKLYKINLVCLHDRTKKQN